MEGDKSTGGRRHLSAKQRRQMRKAGAKFPVESRNPADSEMPTIRPLNFYICPFLKMGGVCQGEAPEGRRVS